MSNIALEMEAGSSSETLVNFYETRELDFILAAVYVSGTTRYLHRLFSIQLRPLILTSNFSPF
jgi:hypothetical protein